MEEFLPDIYYLNLGDKVQTIDKNIFLNDFYQEIVSETPNK